MYPLSIEESVFIIQFRPKSLELILQTIVLITGPAEFDQ